MVTRRRSWVLPQPVALRRLGVTVGDLHFEVR